MQWFVNKCDKESELKADQESKLDTCRKNNVILTESLKNIVITTVDKKRPSPKNGPQMPEGAPPDTVGFL